jgi:Protein of unknown function (DUF3551)
VGYQASTRRNLNRRLRAEPGFSSAATAEVEIFLASLLNNIAASALVMKRHRNTRRSAMRTLLFMLAILGVTAEIGSPAQAQNYPWCADYAGFGSQNCGFTTLQQCQAALSGNGGFCNANTQYVSPSAPPAPRARNHS